jgi:hypothetical protein
VAVDQVGTHLKNIYINANILADVEGLCFFHEDEDSNWLEGLVNEDDVLSVGQKFESAS